MVKRKQIPTPVVTNDDLKEATRSISIKPLEGDYRRWMAVIAKIREAHPECTMRGLFRNAIVILEKHFRL